MDIAELRARVAKETLDLIEQLDQIIQQNIKNALENGNKPKDLDNPGDIGLLVEAVISDLENSDENHLHLLIEFMGRKTIAQM